MKQEYDINEIKSLLEAYYDGTTTIEQEKLLCDFFATASNIPPELEADRQLFVELYAKVDEPFDVPVDLEAKLMSHIDNLERRDTNKRVNWVKLFSIISAAACVIVIFVIGITFFSQEEILIEQNNSFAKIEENEVVTQDEGEGSQRVSDSIVEEENENGEVIKKEDLIYKTKEKNKSKIKPPKVKRVKRKQVLPTNHKKVSEEQLAYENTERALLLLSEKLNIAQKGVKQTENTIKEINNTIIEVI